jgi:uncharacterized protein (TIGR02594 family)
MNNLTLDVLIGLVLIYLVFSIIVSAVTEYVANLPFDVRQKNLRRALQSAFGAESKDDGKSDALTDAFLKNGIILTLYQGKSGPSSIPEPIFAKGLISTLQGEIKLAERPASPAEFVSMLTKSLDGSRFATKDQLLQTLGTLVKGKESNWDAFEKAIADWFAEVGERSIGWYKRDLEWRKLLVALGLALLLNIDTVLIFNVLSIDSRSRQELTTIAADTLIAAKALPDDEKTRQAIAAIAPAGSPIQYRIDVDQGLAKALGLLRNRVIDDGEYLKWVKSRCAGTVDPDSFKDGSTREHCDADLMSWYSRISDLRDGFKKSFQRIECDENVECSAQYPRPTLLGSDAELNKLAEERKSILQSIYDRTKNERDSWQKKEILPLVKDPKDEKQASVGELTDVQKRIRSIRIAVNEIIVRLENESSYKEESKRVANIFKKDIQRKDIEQYDKTLWMFENQIADNLARSNNKFCGSAQASGATQLKSCITDLVEITNNLNLVLGTPAKGGENISKMMAAVVDGLNQARTAAEKRIPVMGRYNERYCERIGKDDLLKASSNSASPSPQLVADIDKERRECSEVFRRARTGDLGLPLSWDEDIRRLRFHMYVPESRWETSEISFKHWALFIIQIVIGFVLTAIALSLGSEFWFNALGRLMAIRLSGARRALEQEAKQVPPTVAGDAGGAAGSPSGNGPTGGPSYFLPALTGAEGRLTKPQILQVQSAIQMPPPLTGEFDKRMREAIHAWHKQRGGADVDLWVLEERHVNELISGQPRPLSADTAGRVNLLAAGALPITPLTLGSRGEEVRLYKALLSSINDKPGADGKPLLSSAEVDDNFDDKTLKVTQAFQADKDLVKDGSVGPATWLRLTSDLELLPVGLREHRWMCHAIHEIGTTEIPGRQSSRPRIEEYQKVTGGKSDDETPWCSSFAAWVMQQAGISLENKVNALASSWREWGAEDNQQTFGSIIVLKKKGTSLKADGSGAHVGFLLQCINGRYFVLGGNQGTPGSVKVSTFTDAAHDVLAIRKPVLAESTGDTDAPSAEQGGSSYSLFNQYPARPRLMRGSDNRQAVMDLQNLLNTVSAAKLKVDGIFGPNTEKAVRAFQIGRGAASGVVDEATWAALDGSPDKSIPSDTNKAVDTLSSFLSKNNLSMAHVLAVRELESNGSGLVKIGSSTEAKTEVKILFEGHQFYRLLKSAGVSEDKLNELQKDKPDLVYPKWDKSHYKTFAGEWGRLIEARGLCTSIKSQLTLPNGCANAEDIANMAASWGLFQIMGFNWELCQNANSPGYCKDVADFVIINKTEQGQTELFLNYLKGRNNGALIKALAAQDWAEFAKLYNGPRFRENRYDIKLKQAFDKYA